MEKEILELFNKDIVLFRFKNSTELIDFVDKMLLKKDMWNYEVVAYAEKSSYDGCGDQDYEVIISIGRKDNEEIIYDVTLYYTLSRIGDKVIVEGAVDYY